MKKIAAGVLGFAAAPMVAALIFSATTPLAKTWDFMTRIKLVVPAYSIAAIVTVLFAVPAFALLLRVNLVRWWTAAGIGFAIGVLIGIMMTGLTLEQIPGILFLAATGVASALAFWSIWRRASES